MLDYATTELITKCYLAFLKDDAKCEDNIRAMRRTRMALLALQKLANQRVCELRKHRRIVEQNREDERN